MTLGWFVVFWEDEGVEETSPCNYCVGSGEECGTCCARKVSKNTLVKERSVGEGGRQTPQL